MQAACVLILHHIPNIHPFRIPVNAGCDQVDQHRHQTPTLASEHSHLAPTYISQGGVLVTLLTYGRRLDRLSAMLDCCLPRAQAPATDDHPVFALVECACDDRGDTLRQFLRDHNTHIAAIKRSGDNITPLHFAVIMSASDDCVALDILLEHSLIHINRDVDADKRGTTPLHNDTITRAPNAQDPLLSASSTTVASASARSSTSSDPRHLTASQRSQAHDRAALFAAQDTQGNTVLFTAALGGHTKALQRLLADPCCDQACLHKPNTDRQDPFFAACWRGRLVCAKELRKAGVDYDKHSTDVDGKTARAIALEWGHSAMVEWLDGGAVVD
eukprot:m.98779 g.98779  ORF g.98779 m.98779 type:complete len:330 (-) comp27096_c0_seq1:77-1066(-)